MGRLGRPLYAIAVVAALALGLRVAPLWTASAMRLPPPSAAERETPVPITFTVAQGMSPDAIATEIGRAHV